MTANQGARRLRACILGVLPGDVVEAAVKQCESTLKTRVEVTPERVREMLERFEAYGVTREQIEARIQRRLDAITPALMVQLGKVYNSLRDGMSSPADWFEPIHPKDGNGGGGGTPATEPARGVSGVKEAIRKRGAAAKASPPEEPPPPPDEDIPPPDDEQPPARDAAEPEPKPGACALCGHNYKASHFNAKGEPRPCAVDRCGCLCAVEQASSLPLG
jgi:hypothetical protein